MGVKTWISILVLLCQVAGTAASRSSLRAKADSQLLQNKRADRDHLSRMVDREMVDSWARLKLLVPVASKTRSFYLHKIPTQYRYVRPWTKLFLDRISSQFYRRFKRPLRITSLTRTVHYQNQLSRRNSNAASPYGAKRSSHLTGASLDISKKGLSGAQVSWLRRVLLSLHQKEYLFAIEEFYQPNYHVMVYRHYPEYVEMLLARSEKRKK
ncbi:MAG: hypothetical protein CMN58_03475 [Solibacterales bacterium]|mgnify:FL=1|nr:hypothetical protein [Bryobacterales bacterium]